jgi:hypothetical protein
MGVRQSRARQRVWIHQTVRRESVAQPGWRANPAKYRRNGRNHSKGRTSREPPTTTHHSHNSQNRRLPEAANHEAAASSVLGHPAAGPINNEFEFMLSE